MKMKQQHQIMEKVNIINAKHMTHWNDENQKWLARVNGSTYVHSTRKMFSHAHD